MIMPGTNNEGKIGGGSSDKAVDFAWIQEMSEGDKGFEKEIFLIFLEDSQLRLDTLVQAIPALDVESVHHEAHTLKGASGNIGAEPLRKRAYQLEKMNLLQQQDEATECLHRMQAEFERVKTAIEGYLGD